MKRPYTRLFLNVFLIALVAAFVAACSKTGIRPHKTNNTSGSDSDSTILALDTLPSFSSPAGVAVDAAGNLYVADYGNDLIRKITPAGVVSTFAGSGNQGSIDAVGALSSFNEPTGVAIDGSGNLFIADAGNDRIRKILPDGTVSTLAGSDSTGSADGVGVLAQFFHPVGVAVDSRGTVYVADSGNDLIRSIVPDGTVSTILGADSTQTINISNPTGVAVDVSGNLYIANYLDNNILKFASRQLNIFAGSGNQGAQDAQGLAASFYYPNSVTTDAAGTLFVSDGVNNLIRKITPDGTVVTIAGSGVAGAADGTGKLASFNGPAGLTVDASDNIYVADSGNNLIRKITAAGVVTTVAGSGLPGAKNGVVVAGSKHIAAPRGTNNVSRLKLMFSKPAFKILNKKIR